MTDRITITGLRARGFHGVLPAERELGQEFVVDLVLHVDTRQAAAGDDLTATANYAEVAREAVEVLTGPPADLIETVAARIAERALRFERVQAVDVVVHKPAAPIPHPFADVTVHIHRPTPAAATSAAAAAAAPAAAEHLRVGSGSAADPEPTRSWAEGGARQPGERAPHAVVVALGANEGDARGALGSALAQLDRHPRVRVAAVSPLVRSRAHVQAGSAPAPDYLNAVATLETTLPVRELLALCQGIELGHGRIRHERWGPRPLDIDLVAAGSLTWHDDDLTLPHPRAHQRSFVLAPWARIDPDAELPGHGRVAELAASVGEDGLEWLADGADEDWRAGR